MNYWLTGVCGELEKVTPDTTQQLVYLRMSFDTEMGTVAPSPARCQSLATMFDQFANPQGISIKMMRLVGKMSSMRELVPLAAVRTRPLQSFLINNYRE